MEISKELLSSVLSKEIIEIQIKKEVIRYVWNDRGMAITEEISIYKLAHECKEWAFTQEDFILESAFVSKGKFTSCYCVAEKNFSYPTLKETFHDNMEQQLIFKACQWILDKKIKG